MYAHGSISKRYKWLNSATPSHLVHPWRWAVLPSQRCSVHSVSRCVHSDAQTFSSFHFPPLLPFCLGTSGHVSYTPLPPQLRDCSALGTRSCHLSNSPRYLIARLHQDSFGWHANSQAPRLFLAIRLF